MSRLGARCVLALLVAIVPFSASAQTETIDFDSIAQRTIVDVVMGDGGTGPIFVTGTNPACSGFSPWNAAVIFDSENPIPADLDLGTPNETFAGPGVGAGGEVGSTYENDIARGHVLIVNECEYFIDRNSDGEINNADSPVERPNDADETGASLEFDFSVVGPVSVTSMVIIDVEADEPSASVEFYNGSGDLITMVSLPQVGDNGVAEIDLGMVSNVDKMIVRINGSGAIDSIIFGPPAPFCGDGNIDPGETCDPPGEPAGLPNECRDDCTFCGDDVLDEGEECDDGNNLDGDGCDAFCMIEEPVCGDGDVNAPGETCDPPGVPAGQPDECRDDCTFCGDEVLDEGEECDDGNNVDGDGCDAYCMIEPFCGDDEVNAPGETCDPPGVPAGQPNECRDDCTFCGDEVLDEGEECDDGNNVDGDGCDAYCMIEPFCGDDEVNAPGETCDPPGVPAGQPDECRDDCTFCGDEVLDEGEQCDDGNNVNGDGCDAYCMIEVVGEGCTPGYWKQSQHFCNWELSQADLFDDVFGVDAPGNDTLLKALSDGAGGETALQRHAVAALLNSLDDGVDYAFSALEVIAIVQEAYATGDFGPPKDILEYENEMGCPLGNCAERDDSTDSRFE